MNFTIFLNTRGRTNQFARCLEAVESNTKDPSKVEFIVKADIDDLETVLFLRELNDKRKTFNFKPIVSERPPSLCSSFNQMARQGKGKYMFVLTDDAEVMTKNWDEIALARIEEFKVINKIKDDIIYGRTSDTSIDKGGDKKYASFPIISKQAIDTLGFFMYDSFVGLGGDSSIYRVYEQVKRVVDLTEIQLDHVYNNSIFKIMTPDLTGHEMRVKTAMAGSIDPFTFDISKEVEKLKRVIK
jgi:hypothetical protein